MKTQLRIFWLVSLLFFTTGCSIYQPACFTGTEGVDNDDMSRLADCRLQVGDSVRITTTSGDRVAGEIQRLTEKWIVLTTEGHGEPARLFAPSWILRIEKSKSPPGDPDPAVTPEVGKDVYVLKTDGSAIRGEVGAVNDEAVVLIHESGPDQRLEIPREDILWMDTNSAGEAGGSGNGTSVWVTVGALVVIGAAVTGFYLARLDLDSWSD